MAVYDDLPTWDIDILQPTSLEKFRVSDEGVEGGRGGLNRSQVISFSGGGIVIGGYGECDVRSDLQHEYHDMVETRLSATNRYMNIPILSDISAPMPIVAGSPRPFLPRLFDDDGSIVSGPILEEPTVTGVFMADAALHAGVVQIALLGAARSLRYGLWFSTQHANKGHRAYSVWEIQAAGPSDVYTVAISPPLREAVTDGTPIRVSHPLCVMRYPPGYSSVSSVRSYWQSSPSFMFEEAP